MRREARGLGLLLALAAAACSSWSGPTEGGIFTKVPDPSAGTDAGETMDGGPKPRPDAGNDAGIDAGDDAGRDAGGEPSLGDDRAGFTQCSPEASCTGSQLCCTTNVPEPVDGGTPVAPWSMCMASCSVTEGSYACDGPEDCETGQVCCHQFTASGLKGVCLAAEAPSTGGTDGGMPTPVCNAGPEGSDHVACHAHADCAGVEGKPLCQAAADRGYLGYCAGDTDELATPGHDDVGLVGCGDRDHDGVGALCNLGSQICCQSRQTSSQAACAEREECGFSELHVSCDGPEDCPGADVCCYVPPQAGADGGPDTDAQMACAAKCADEAPNALTRCHSDADCSALPSSPSCRRDPAAPWWGVCAP